eukprot:scaffold47885_cov36-Phaeocystis_antarctica.AAC.1
MQRIGGTSEGPNDLHLGRVRPYLISRGSTQLPTAPRERARIDSPQTWSWVVASRYSYLHARHFTRFQNLKNPATSWHADCRDLTSLCLRLCIGVKLRAASVP